MARLEVKYLLTLSLLVLCSLMVGQRVSAEVTNSKHSIEEVLIGDHIVFEARVVSTEDLGPVLCEPEEICTNRKFLFKLKPTKFLTENIVNRSVVVQTKRHAPPGTRKVIAHVIWKGGGKYELVSMASPEKFVCFDKAVYFDLETNPDTTLREFDTKEESCITYR